MNSKKSISSSAVISWALSIIYYLVFLIIGEKRYVDFAFIALHLIVVALILIASFWMYFSVNIVLAINAREVDKNFLRSTLKTLPLHATLGIFSWLLPIGQYLYYLTHFKIFYVFIWLPIWFPIIYYFFQRYIKTNEIKLGLPDGQTATGQVPKLPFKKFLLFFLILSIFVFVLLVSMFLSQLLP